MTLQNLDQLFTTIQSKFYKGEYDRDETLMNLKLLILKIAELRNVDDKVKNRLSKDIEDFREDITIENIISNVNRASPNDESSLLTNLLDILVDENDKMKEVLAGNELKSLTGRFADTSKFQSSKKIIF